MDDVEKVAAELSENEAHVLCQMRKRFSIHPGAQSAFVRHFLRKAEIELGLLTNPSFDNYFLTPRGLAVRNYLMESRNV